MLNEVEILDKAMQCVREDQSSLQTECEAFREFRDTISHARPATSGDTDSGTETDQLLEAYQETVMSTPNFETTYGESLVESLTAELPSSAANTLVSEDRITQQQKRNLLLASNHAIHKREQFEEILAAEVESLQAIQKSLHDIETKLEELPPCTIQHLSFEEYIEVWEICDTLLERCDQLLQKRQVMVTEAKQPADAPENDAHAFNEYLYHNLETSYPAIRAITETRQCIERFRGEEKSGTSFEQRDGPTLQ
jgi:DNA mismatch repair ATPase MutL